ncbi:MAG: cell division protein FtsW [Acidobacteria bacterium 13_1_40CM_2_64_6]|nr:MAG: cell division protein FtsW [Acidobacteria bacterium 13_1_40CM_65_14]OLC80267.1 MAG: cell division protein FtsW [Acidobacteria bacterium 13_1_40CM_4_65_8]OLD18628.1 MAG: cell division protein FtsW [Acidobacteria bacterium 13_1_40CM_3_65_5]OLD55789.1 MAG: cell division protein FtsW [Acidobacteria bacterium 13_1_40CM_2_64_6]OLE79463.1 MAG: cell division protein FtsW [Acidobacteria bacterium 13_1_20CM_2_65_9]
MARKLKSDKVLFLATLLLVCLSIVMVYSASAVVTLERYGRPSMFLVKQAMWAVLGLGMLGLVTRIDYRTYREPVFIWTSLVIVVIALVAVLFMPPVNNARRWFGIAGIGVQPSELSKLAAIFFIAALLERRMHRINELGYALAPIGLLVGGLFGLIMLEPDFGTSMSLVLIASVMVFAAGLNYRYIVGAALVALPAMYILVMGTAYRRRRMLTFLNPWEDPLGDGFQIIQSLIAIGTGGVWGKGLMNGVQKLFYLPEPHTDFIYSVISEELGLLGASAVLLCFCVVTWRGLRVSLRAPDSFGAFLALGLTTMVAVQAFINISVVLGLMPTKGIPLPLVSFGGSSLLINLVGMGILLNVSQHVSSEA